MKRKERGFAAVLLGREVDIMSLSSMAPEPETYANRHFPRSD